MSVGGEEERGDMRHGSRPLLTAEIFQKLKSVQF